MQSRVVHVDQADMTRCAVVSRPVAPLADGQARLRVEHFALTANNVTYAVTGFQIGYWQFFPSGVDGQGIAPAWGAARVVDSRSPALEPGTRLYGFCPMAEDIVIVPRADAGGGIADAAPHRADLPGVYNRYTVLRGGPSDDDHLRALLQPLLATSWLLCDWLADNRWFGAERIVIGSASSKTGLGLCKFLAETADRPYRITGLTSAANRGFVSGLGACDRVLTYDQVESLDRVPTVYVDMSGDAAVKARLHRHLGDHVRHSAAVGLSHWDRFAPPAADLPGARPRFFFAPDQVRKRRADWGPGVVEERIAAAWKRIAAQAGDWLTLRPHDGLDAVPAVWRALACGTADPRDGHVIRLPG